MTREEEDDLIGDFTTDAWAAWVKAGWKEAFCKELGPLQGPREEAIFHDAWKLGCAAGIQLARDIAAEFAKRN
jgi:hypothetical protein